jgi:heme/copper-type cytochrome/quinol oxidase subunit 2
MSEAEEIYNACMLIVTARAEAIQERNIWILVGCILASVIAISILIWFCCYRRNKRKKQKNNTGTNNNTDEKRNRRTEEDEAMTVNMLPEGNKS